MAVKLNLGCGKEVMVGFINHDIAKDGVDLRDLGIYENGSVDEIRCCHALEHIGRDEVQSALREWHRALRVGGRVVITCPDVIACMERFLDCRDEIRWRPKYLNETIWGCQTSEHECHKTGFSMERLCREVTWAGFKVVYTECIEQDHNAPGLLVEAIK